MQEQDRKSTDRAIAGLKRGDISCLETLVRLYQVAALEATYLITHDYALAEDLVQDAFLRAYERIHQFDQARPFAPWFLRSVVNSALTAVTSPRNQHISLDKWGSQPDAQESSGYSIAGDVVEVPSLEPGLQEIMEAAETREEILATLEKLPPAQRAAVVMRYYLDWSDAEVAQRLGIPPSTVRWRLHNARHRLQVLLAAWSSPPQG